MEELKIRVYDDDDNIVKEVTAKNATIRFGAVRQMMKLLKIDDLDNTSDLLNVVLDAWDELTKILCKFFPEMTEDDWDNVNINELVPVVFVLLKNTFRETLKIPNDPKN